MRVLLAVVALGLSLGLGAGSGALAQTSLPMRGLGTDPSAPIEIEADALEVAQSDGSATFRGNVLIAQGALRLGATEVRVEYVTPEGAPARMSRLTATGSVTLASGSEQAESELAIYDVDTGQITMTGDVLLTQGPTIVSGERLVVDLAAGTGVMEGRVRTVIDPGRSPGAATGGTAGGSGGN